MTKTVSMLKVRRKLNELLTRVAEHHDQFIIARNGKTLAAMVPVDRLKDMERAELLHLLRVLKKQPGTLAQRDADRLANSAKHQTRRRSRT